jgi:uncharacterized UPF0160 family protein
LLEIIRTRDPAVIDKQAIVVDVGGVYDPAKCVFVEGRGACGVCKIFIHKP